MFAAPISAQDGMVSAADPRAAEAGAEMLRRGGSAVDAAFATLLALNVVEPESSGIGGGGYLVYSPRGGPPVTFDGRETAPPPATGSGFTKTASRWRTRMRSPAARASAVPGNLRMMAMAHRRYGQACRGRRCSSPRSGSRATASGLRRGLQRTRTAAGPAQ